MAAKPSRMTSTSSMWSRVWASRRGCATVHGRARAERLGGAMAGDPIICDDFHATLARLQAEGARLESLWPADDPHSAVLTQAGARLRLTSRPEAPAPGGPLPAFRPEFILTRASAGGGEGRAGMRYRDLIPGRLGGHVI